MVHHIVKETTSCLQTPHITLFSAATPNSFQVTIFLELLNVDYYVRPIDIVHGENNDYWFTKLNPNGKVPSLEHVSEIGEIVHVNESAAILLFLADRYDKENKYSFLHGTNEYYEVLECICFLMSECPMKCEYYGCSSTIKHDELSVDKLYKNTLQLFRVLETKLVSNNTGYLVSDHFTLADITAYPWVGGASKIKELDNYPNLSQWVENLEQIPEIIAALQILNQA